jgi:hypothetical protein
MLQAETGPPRERIIDAYAMKSATIRAFDSPSRSNLRDLPAARQRLRR